MSLNTGLTPAQGGHVKLSGLVAICVYTVLTSSIGLAQSTGTVRGVVKDPSGGVLPGANVTLTNAARHLSNETVTTQAGAYVFAFVPPGTYTLTAEKPGFSR